MKFSAILDRFIIKSPISVMARALMERAFNPEQMDQWFANTADKQYTRKLLFSTTFNIMIHVVLGTYKSVHAAFQANQSEMVVSVKSLYNKLDGFEISSSAKLVRYAADQAKSVIEKLGGQSPPLLPGFRVKMLDGNCIEATHKRIKELRDIAGGALPGKSLVVYDPSLRLPIDVFPCEDGHAQERSLLADVLTTVEQNDVWICDRNFCVISFLFGIAQKMGFFIIRQHGNLPWQPVGKSKYKGRIKTGRVYEQPITITDDNGNTMQLRRIRVILDDATRDGDQDIFILTNLPHDIAPAKTIAELYRKRWNIETVFQELSEHFNSEINTLGYPSAAIFGFCVALVSYTILSTIKAALSCVHGEDVVENKISGYYLADEIEMTSRGMAIAIEEEEWNVFNTSTPTQLAQFLKKLARNVDISKYLKHPRGPKKPKAKPKSDPKRPHVSTAKIIAQRKR